MWRTGVSQGILGWEKEKAEAGKRKSCLQKRISQTSDNLTSVMDHIFVRKCLPMYISWPYHNSLSISTSSLLQYPELGSPNSFIVSSLQCDITDYTPFPCLLLLTISLMSALGEVADPNLSINQRRGREQSRWPCAKPCRIKTWRKPTDQKEGQMR